MRRQLALLLCLSLAIAAAAEAAEAEGGTLRMRGGGAAFKIALFADLHFGEDAWTEWGPVQDLNSVGVMRSVLDDERPDFVIYLGDVVTANNIMVANASLYWDQALSPTRTRGVPWCTIFGNHDDASFEWPLEWFSEAGIPQLRCPSVNSSSAVESDLRQRVNDQDSRIESNVHLESGGGECSFRGTTRLELMRGEIKGNTLSLSNEGPRNLWPSVSNYVLKLSSLCNAQEPVAFMYFFDSGGGSYPEIISNAQVKWFQQKSKEINPHSMVPEIIFWHIPSKAYKKVAPKFDMGKHCVGSIFSEEVAPQEAEMGMMKVLEQRPSVKAIFVGHNHGLDWCCPYKKLWLCFARHTGYGGYGSWARGARVLEINQKPFSLKSWIRMEDGSAHSEVILSS